jgi:hypothetical protein
MTNENTQIAGDSKNTVVLPPNAYSSRNKVPIGWKDF